MTILQELINKWKLESKYIDLVPFVGIIQEAESLLEKEKQQIARAFDMADNINTGTFMNGLDYYEQEY